MVKQINAVVTAPHFPQPGFHRAVVEMRRANHQRCDGAMHAERDALRTAAAKHRTTAPLSQ